MENITINSTLTTFNEDIDLYFGNIRVDQQFVAQGSPGSYGIIDSYTIYINYYDKNNTLLKQQYQNGGRTYFNSYGTITKSGLFQIPEIKNVRKISVSVSAVLKSAGRGATNVSGTANYMKKYSTTLSSTLEAAVTSKLEEYKDEIILCSIE